MASLQQIMGQIKDVEDTFNKCLDISGKIYPRRREDAVKRFIWENNLMKFYMEYNVDKACDFGHDLLHDLQEILPAQEANDLKFSLAVK